MEIVRFRFRDLGATRRGDVLVKTGALWWRRTEWRGVFKPDYSCYWRWSGSGEFAPDAVAGMALAEEYDPTNGKPLG
jgi:hypothetical protein